MILNDDYWTLTNNCVFGKTFENRKNYIDLRLTTDHEKGVKIFTKLHVKGGKYLDGLRMVEMFKQYIVYDKPLYVGTSVLDSSELHMMKMSQRCYT
ncbi:MAG: hypothetical protein ACKPKO_31560, partial [Candidatus Fonsibacter sp.]